ncbi:unnamed protein product [Didymodactylos carnosus]|nr:unnamed protein product [Didymodactylos carnosus]CAF3739269.1 unnamed protein product [Didymodactylos carnosus]
MITSPRSGRIVATTTTTVDMNENNGPVVITSEIHHKEVNWADEKQQEPRATSDLVHSPHISSPYGNIGRVHAATTSSASTPTRHHHQRQSIVPKKKVRKPSQEFLQTKSEESELSTDDLFWEKNDDDNKRHKPKHILHEEPEVVLTPTNIDNQQQRTLTNTPQLPGTPNTNFTMKPSPSGSGSVGTLRTRAHNFISRSILMPETCCVCIKRIHFGKLAYRCLSCSALCHMSCKENCTTLCLPNVKTPSRGAIANFTPKEGPMIPSILVHCVKEIEQRGFQEVGIYRLNAVDSQVKALKDRILKSRTGMFDLSHIADINTICGVVKDFLRSLSESLLTQQLWKTFALVIEEESDYIKQQKLELLILQLPKPNRDTLAFMILHLQRVAATPQCRMPILNLTRTMGPCIIGYSSKHVNGIDVVGETYKQTKILEFFLKMSSDYWAKFVDESATTTNEHEQPLTPIKMKQHHLYPSLHRNVTPSAPYYLQQNNNFFSPI